MAVKVLRAINTQSTLAVLSRLLQTRKSAWASSLENSCSPGNDKDLFALIRLMYKYTQNTFPMFKKLHLVPYRIKTIETLGT